MAEFTFLSQSAGLDSLINARTLDGYVMKDGRKIKKGRLLRGGSLTKASYEDLRKLKEKYNLSYVFDFRTEMEVQLAPDKEVEGAKNIWLPTIDPETEKLGTMTLPKDAYRHLEVYLIDNSFRKEVQVIASHIYSDMIRNEYTQLQYAAFLQMIVNTPDGGVYWHCSQGKDRTGLGAAFLLYALGADRETVVADFDISNEFYRDIVRELKEKVAAKGGTEKEFAVIQTFIGVNLDYFNEVLDIIDNEYGGMDSYLRNQLVLTDEDIETLRNNLLE